MLKIIHNRTEIDGIGFGNLVKRHSQLIWCLLVAHEAFEGQVCVPCVFNWTFSESFGAKVLYLLPNWHVLDIFSCCFDCFVFCISTLFALLLWWFWLPHFVCVGRPESLKIKILRFVVFHDCQEGILGSWNFYTKVDGICQARHLFEVLWHLALAWIVTQSWLPIPLWWWSLDSAGACSLLYLSWPIYVFHQGSLIQVDAQGAIVLQSIRRSSSILAPILW